MNTNREAQIADHLMHILRESSAARRGRTVALSDHPEDGDTLILAGPPITSPTLRALSLALGDSHGLCEITEDVAEDFTEGATGSDTEGVTGDVTGDVAGGAAPAAGSDAQHGLLLRSRSRIHLRAPDGSGLTIVSIGMQTGSSGDLQTSTTGASDKKPEAIDDLAGRIQDQRQDDDPLLVEKVRIAAKADMTAPETATPETAAPETAAPEMAAAIAPAGTTPPSKESVIKKTAGREAASSDLDNVSWREALDEARLLTAALERFTLADLLDGILDGILDRGSSADNDTIKRKRAAARSALATWRADPARSAFVLLANQDVVTDGARMSAPSSITVRDLRLLKVRQGARPRCETPRGAHGAGPADPSRDDRPGIPRNIPARVFEGRPAGAPDILSGGFSGNLSAVSTSADKVDAIVGLASGSITSAISKLLDVAWRKIVSEEPSTRLPAWLNDGAAPDGYATSNGPGLPSGLVLNDAARQSAVGRRGRPFAGTSHWLSDKDAAVSGGADLSAHPPLRRDRHLRAVLAAAREIAAASMLSDSPG